MEPANLSSTQLNALQTSDMGAIPPATVASLKQHATQYALTSTNLQALSTAQAAALGGFHHADRQPEQHATRRSLFLRTSDVAGAVHLRPVASPDHDPAQRLGSTATQERSAPRRSRS
ncbi:MAG: hypothetical protein IPK39_14020 [Sulfuritalea sp.]|nr:hypothetical protein [Sulfuritalea sp.]